MSTYWYYECLDHTPPLQAADEFTQHTGDRHYQRAIDLTAARPVDPNETYWSTADMLNDADRSDAYFSMNARRFLVAHPTCRLGFVNEYGDHRPLPAWTSTEGENT